MLKAESKITGDVNITLTPYVAMFLHDALAVVGDCDDSGAYDVLDAAFEKVGIIADTPWPLGPIEVMTVWDEAVAGIDGEEAPVTLTPSDDEVTLRLTKGEALLIRRLLFNNCGAVDLHEKVAIAYNGGSVGNGNYDGELDLDGLLEKCNQDAK